MGKFMQGFLLCYVLAGIGSANAVAQIPATTKAGVVYAGVMWLPINLLPDSVARQLIPEWAFDFEKGNRP